MPAYVCTCGYISITTVYTTLGIISHLQCDYDDDDVAITRFNAKFRPRTL